MTALAISVSERLKILRTESESRWDDAIEASTDVKPAQRDEAMAAWDEAIDAALSDRFDDANESVRRAWRLAEKVLVNVNAEVGAHMAICHAEEMVQEAANTGGRNASHVSRR